MAVQTVFKRYELKYPLTEQQKQTMLATMADFMEPDAYGRTTVRNIYFDTDNYRLVRRSIDKPAYKEKLRLRSYQQTGPDSTVFVELKKKYEGIVYSAGSACPKRKQWNGWPGRTVAAETPRFLGKWTIFYSSMELCVQWCFCPTNGKLTRPGTAPISG